MFDSYERLTTMLVTGCMKDAELLLRGVSFSTPDHPCTSPNLRKHRLAAPAERGVALALLRQARARAVPPAGLPGDTACYGRPGQGPGAAPPTTRQGREDPPVIPTRRAPGPVRVPAENLRARRPGPGRAQLARPGGPNSANRRWRPGGGRAGPMVLEFRTSTGRL